VSLWSHNGKGERKESEREVGFQRWREMSSYGSVFVSAVLEAENEEGKGVPPMGDSFLFPLFDIMKSDDKNCALYFPDGFDFYVIIYFHYISCNLLQFL
jgi:hypothetical protein